MEEVLDFLIKYGYVILAIYSFAGGFLTLLAAGTLASIGKMDITAVIVIATVFNFLGDFFFFTYVKFLKKYFTRDYNALAKKFGRKAAYTRLLIRKKGWIGMFIQKYLYIVRTLYPIVLGMMGYSTKKFMILNLAASLLWATSLGLFSYFFSSIIIEFFK